MSHDLEKLREALETLCAASRELSGSLVAMTDWTRGDETQCVLAQHALSLQLELSAAQLLESAKLQPRQAATAPGHVLPVGAHAEVPRGRS